MNSQVIYGRNAVQEALKADRPLEKVYLQKETASNFSFKLINSLRLRGIPYTLVDKASLNRIAEGGNHQGVAAVFGAKTYLDFEQLLSQAAKVAEPFLLAVSQIYDPHNLGSLLRSGAGADLQGIIIPRRHSCGLTPVVAKVSAGGIEYLPVCRVTNIALTLDQLREEGYRVIGADAQGEKDYTRVSYRGAIALVMGGEDKNLTAHLKKRCDEVVRINLPGKITSLNLGVAAGVLIFEVLRQRAEGN